MKIKEYIDNKINEEVKKKIEHIDPNISQAIADKKAYELLQDCMGLFQKINLKLDQAETLPSSQQIEIDKFHEKLSKFKTGDNGIYDIIHNLRQTMKKSITTKLEI